MDAQLGSCLHLMLDTFDSSWGQGLARPPQHLLHGLRGTASPRIWFRVEVLGLTQWDVISRGIIPIPMAWTLCMCVAATGQEGCVRLADRQIPGPQAHLGGPADEGHQIQRPDLC